MLLDIKVELPKDRWTYEFGAQKKDLGRMNKTQTKLFNFLF